MLSMRRREWAGHVRLALLFLAGVGLGGLAPAASRLFLRHGGVCSCSSCLEWSGESEELGVAVRARLRVRLREME